MNRAWGGAWQRASPHQSTRIKNRYPCPNLAGEGHPGAPRQTATWLCTQPGPRRPGVRPTCRPPHPLPGFLKSRAPERYAILRFLGTAPSAAPQEMVADTRRSSSVGKKHWILSHARDPGHMVPFFPSASLSFLPLVPSDSRMRILWPLTSFLICALDREPACVPGCQDGPFPPGPPGPAPAQSPWRAVGRQHTHGAGRSRVRA